VPPQQAARRCSGRPCSASQRLRAPGSGVETVPEKTGCTVSWGSEGAFPHRHAPAKTTSTGSHHRRWRTLDTTAQLRGPMKVGSASTDREMRVTLPKRVA
jgi:hypothetical protein